MAFYWNRFGANRQLMTPLAEGRDLPYRRLPDLAVACYNAQFDI
jgi:hypothetical protein